MSEFKSTGSAPASLPSFTGITHQVKYYPVNRRLYLGKSSNYTDMVEVREMITRGDRVRVVNKATGEDKTRWLLMKLLVQLEECFTEAELYALVRSKLPTIEGP
jgi:polyhydroxyalkanoate synthesis regulator protein